MMPSLLPLLLLPVLLLSLISSSATKSFKDRLCLPEGGTGALVVKNPSKISGIMLIRSSLLKERVESVVSCEVDVSGNVDCSGCTATVFVASESANGNVVTDWEKKGVFGGDVEE